MIGPVGDGLRRGRDAFLVAKCRPGGPHTRRHDQPACRLGQGADQRRLARGTDHAIGPGGKGPPGAFHDDVPHIARPDQRGVEIGAFQRCQDGDGKDLQVLARGPFLGGANHIRVAVNGQEIEVELRDTPDRRLHRRADVKELHVEEDALAVILLQLIGQRQAAAGQHAKADLVETDRIAKPPGKVQPVKRIGNIEGDDQPVVGAGLGQDGHGATSFWTAAGVRVAGAAVKRVGPESPGGARPDVAEG